MSLSDRIRSAQPTRSNAGCESCRFLNDVEPGVITLVNEWINAGHSQTQLYEILATPDESGEPTLGVSISAWRWHMKHHRERFDGAQ